jgi:hypothetical protein
MKSRWTIPILVDAVALAMWALAAVKGHAVDMLWLPAVVIGAAWPSNTQRVRGCLARARRTST